MSFLTVMPHGDPSPWEKQQASDPTFIAMFCFEDAVQPGVREAVEALRTGAWRLQGGRIKDSKAVVMLTGESQH